MFKIFQEILRAEVIELLAAIKNIQIKTAQNLRDNSKMLKISYADDNVCRLFTGWSRPELQDMLDSIRDKVRTTENRTTLEAFWGFWMYLRLDWSFEMVALHFGIKEWVVRRSFYTIADALFNSDLISHNIGFSTY